MAKYRGPERRTLPDYIRIDVSDMTPRTAPPYAFLTFIQRNSHYVLAPENANGRLLIGRYGVNYFPDGKASSDGIYIRRWDVPPVRGPRGRLSQVDNDPQKTEG